MINYNNKSFNIETNDFYDKIEATWKCSYHRRTKDKPKNKRHFCNTTIKGVKDIFTDKFSFFVKEEHSSVCQGMNSENIIDEKEENRKDEFNNLILQKIIKKKINIQKPLKNVKQ